MHIYIYAYVCMNIRMYIYIYVCTYAYVTTVGTLSTPPAAVALMSNATYKIDLYLSIVIYIMITNTHVFVPRTQTQRMTHSGTRVCALHTHKKKNIHVTHIITCVFVHSKHKQVRVSPAFHTPWLSLSLSLVISFSFALSLSLSHARGAISPPMPRASSICSLSCCRSPTHAQTR